MGFRKNNLETFSTFFFMSTRNHIPNFAPILGRKRFSFQLDLAQQENTSWGMKTLCALSGATFSLHLLASAVKMVNG